MTTVEITKLEEVNLPPIEFGHQWPVSASNVNY